MGYDVDRFVGDVKEGLLCCICRDVLEDPLQAPCEHAYCTTCIMAWLVDNNSCPEDRRPLTAPLLRPLSRYMRNDLEKLRIRCRNSQAGCEVVAELESIDRHEADCSFHTQQCPNVGCTVMLGSDQLEEHLRVCESHSKQCPNGCGLPIMIMEDANHNCVAELRSSMELLSSEMTGRLEGERREFELLLDDQRRHVGQKDLFLLSQVERLNSQMALVLKDVQSLCESERRHEFEIERAVLQRQRFLNVVAVLRHGKTSDRLTKRRYYSRQSSLPVEASRQ